jgi:uncharacterized membrane-anchored protein YhcB (DUF1043 family)
MAVDPNLSFWLAVTGSIIVGVVAGILFQRSTGSAGKRAAKLEADLAQARSDLARYREETARHFGKSADLLGRMASDYREFLDHFVGGAEELCGGNLKEISVNGLERPLLDAASAATLPTVATPSTDAESLAEDTPK